MRTAFFVLMLLPFFSCKKEIKLWDGAISINECKQKSFGSKSVIVCFEELIDDSRCPVNQDCIWEGEARGRFSIEINGSKTYFEQRAYSKKEVQGYTVHLVNIHPFPGSGDPGPLRAEIEISQ